MAQRLRSSGRLNSDMEQQQDPPVTRSTRRGGMGTTSTPTPPPSDNGPPPSTQALVASTTTSSPSPPASGPPQAPLPSISSQTVSAMDPAAAVSALTALMQYLSSQGVSLPQVPPPTVPSAQPSTAPPGGVPSSSFVSAGPVVGATAAAVPITAPPSLLIPTPPGGASSAPAVPAGPELGVSAAAASTPSHSSFPTQMDRLNTNGPSANLMSRSATTSAKQVVTERLRRKYFKNEHGDTLSSSVDYMRWRGKFCTTAKALDVWGYYTGNMIPDPSSPDGLDILRANSYLCYDFLKQHMDLEHSGRLDQFDAADNPALEAWAYLEKSKYNKLAGLDAETQLLTMQLQPGEPLLAYLDRGINLRMALNTHRRSMPDSEWIECMTRYLPTSLQPLHTQCLSNDGMTEAQFIQIFRKIASSHSSSPTPPVSPLQPLLPTPLLPPLSTVNAAVATTYPAKVWTNMTCARCGEKGHKHRACPNMKDFPNFRYPHMSDPDDKALVLSGKYHEKYPSRDLSPSVHSLTVSPSPQAPPIPLHGPTPPLHTNLGAPHTSSPFPSTLSLNNIRVEAAASNVRNSNPSDLWIADTGASNHMTGSAKWFQRLLPLSSPSIVRTANGGTTQAVAHGSVLFRSNLHPDSTFTVHNILLVPGLQVNILSGSQLRKHGVYMRADADCWWMCTSDGAILAQGIDTGEQELVLLDATPLPPTLPVLLCHSALVTSNPGTWERWHHRLAHTSPDRMQQLQRFHLVTGLDVSPTDKKATCPGCTEAHLSRLPFPCSFRSAKRPLDLVHADLNTYTTLSFDRKKYMLVLVDHFSRFLWTFSLSHKSEVATVIQSWLPYAERYLDSRLKTFRSDQGGEFTSHALQNYLQTLGIYFETSNTDTPQQNGVAERMNRTVTEMLTAVLTHMDLPTHWWSLALPWVTWVRNVLPSRALQASETPYTKAIGVPPDLSMLKVFGCMCQYLVPSRKHRKLDTKAQWAIHAGFEAGMKGWKLLDVTTGTFIVSRDVYFYEDLTHKAWLHQQQQHHLSALTSPPLSSWPPYSPPPEDLLSLPADTLSTDTATEEAAPQPFSSTVVPPPIPQQCSTPPPSLSILSESPPSIGPLAPPTAPTTSGTHASESFPSTGPHKATNDDCATLDASSPPTPMPSPLSPEAPQTSPTPPVSSTAHPTRGWIVYSRRGRKKGALARSRARQPLVTTRLLRPRSVACNLVQVSTSPSVVSTNVPQSPSSYLQAMADDPLPWRQACDAEMEMLEQLGTWELTSLPPGTKPIGTRWVFKKKWGEGGYNIYKARLVAKGFVQKAGIDYGDTYAPVSSIITVRCLLSIAAARRHHIWQADVKNAFLHGRLDRPLYVSQPEGYSDGTDRVYKLKKALYGLKQSPLMWYTALQQGLQQIGFRRCPAEPALFFHQRQGVTIWVVVYVDDLLLVSPSETLLSTVFSSLSSQFTMKRIEPVETYLGVQIERDSANCKIRLHQARYITEATAGISKGHARSPLTPKLQEDPLSDQDSPAMDETSYLSLAGKISYAACSTRPDLAWPYSWISSGNKQRTFQMVQEAERCLRYMKCTPSLGLLYQGGETNLKLTMYVDASYRQGEHCNTGYVAVLGGAAVSWRCRRQKQKSDSSCAAEFRAAKSAAKEVVWLRYLLEFLDCRQEAVTLACDSKSAVHLMKSVAVHGKSKDLCRDLPLLRDWTTDGEISPQHISGEKQPADFLTKSLSIEAFNRCKAAVGLATNLHTSPSQLPITPSANSSLVANHAAADSEVPTCNYATLHLPAEFTRQVQSQRGMLSCATERVNSGSV